MPKPLKPCAFCGGMVELHEDVSDCSHYPTTYEVTCYNENCGIVGPTRDTAAVAIAAWNARPIEKANDITGLEAAPGLRDYRDEHLFFQVASHKEVRLCSEIIDLTEQRKTFMSAGLPENRGFGFGAWLDVESFIIALQAYFVPDDNTRALQAFVSSIKEVNDRTSADDGISQTVTTKSGAVLVSESKVPNPVELRPYRTFLEVEQPAISCVFRLQQGPKLALFEAGGGLWRLEAIKSIKEYLVAELAKLEPAQKIPVIG